MLNVFSLQYFFILLALLILVLAGAVVAMSQVLTYHSGRRETNFYPQGIEKLSDPFMDTLSRYQRGRHGTIETVWDDVQTQVTVLCMTRSMLLFTLTTVAVLWGQLTQGLE